MLIRYTRDDGRRRRVRTLKTGAPALEIGWTFFQIGKGQRSADGPDSLRPRQAFLLNLPTDGRDSSCGRHSIAYALTYPLLSSRIRSSRSVVLQTRQDAVSSGQARAADRKRRSCEVSSSSDSSPPGATCDCADANTLQNCRAPGRQLCHTARD